MGTLRVAVDHDVCEANGVCERLVPDVFRLDDDDVLEILLPLPPDELAELVREAVARCPKQALSLNENTF